MNLVHPHHPADHESMCHEHQRFNDDVSDAAMKLQDGAYELGRLRGRVEGAAPLLALLKELIDIEGPQPGTADWKERVAAQIAKAEGGQQ